MNSLIAANSFGNSCASRGKDASVTQSMDGFLAAVNKMRSTVMVPSVLKDIDYEEATHSHPNPPHAIIKSGNAEQKGVLNPDLLLCYKMVDAVTNDLVSGSVPQAPKVPKITVNGEEENAEEPENEVPDEDRFVGFFRGQVQGFVNALHQMTEMANLLTRTYNESLDQ